MAAEFTVTNRTLVHIGDGQGGKNMEIIMTEVGKTNSVLTYELMTTLRKIDSHSFGFVGNAGHADVPSIDETLQKDGRISTGTALTIDFKAAPTNSFVTTLIGH